MANVIPEVILLSSDEETPPQVGLSSNSKGPVKPQNTGTRQIIDGSKSSSSVQVRSSLKSVSNYVKANVEKRTEKHPYNIKPQQTQAMKHASTLNIDGTTELIHSSNSRNGLAANLNKGNSSDFRTNSPALAQDLSRGISSNVKQLSAKETPSQNHPRSVAKKSFSSPHARAKKDVTKWIIDKNPSTFPTQSKPVSSNLGEIFLGNKKLETFSNSGSKNPVLSHTSIYDMSATAVSSNQHATLSSVSSTRLVNKDIETPRKAKKSLSNSKYSFHESFERTLSKTGVSITHVPKDTMNSNDVPNSAISSASKYNKVLPFNNSSNLQSTISNSTNSLNMCSTGNRTEIPSTQSRNNSTSNVISLESQNVRSILKSNQPLKSVNLTPYCDISKKNVGKQTVKPPEIGNDAMRFQKNSSRVNRNPTLLKTSNSQHLTNSEISITKVETNRRMNSTSSNNNIKPSTVSSLLNSTQSSTALQLGQPKELHISALPPKAKKSKLENHYTQMKLQSKVNSSGTPIIVQSSRSELAIHSTAKPTFSENKRKISTLKKNLEELVGNKSLPEVNITLPTISSVKSLKDLNSSEFMEMNTQSKYVESVSTDVVTKNITSLGIADQHKVSAQETLSCKESFNEKAKENNCLQNKKEDQSAKQGPTKQVTSPKLSLKRKTYTAVENDHPSKKNKVECSTELNKPLLHLSVDQLSSQVKEKLNRVPWESSDDGSVKLKKLLDFSVPIMKKLEHYQTGEENRISKTLLKCLQSTKTFASSSHFNDLILDTYKKIKDKPKELFVHLINLKKAIAANKCKEGKSKPTKSCISGGTTENLKVQSASLESSISNEINKVPNAASTTKPMQFSPESLMSIHHDTSKKIEPTAAKSMIAEVVLKKPELSPSPSTSLSNHDQSEQSVPAVLISPNVCGTPGKSETQSQTQISVYQDTSKKLETALESPIATNTEGKTQSPPETPLFICHYPSGFIECTSVNSPITANSLIKTELQPLSTKSNDHDQSEKVEPTAMNREFVIQSTEISQKKPEFSPLSINHDQLEEFKSISVKSSIVHNTPEDPEIQSPSLISDALHSSEEALSTTVKSSIVHSTSEDPEILSPSLITDVLHSSEEALSSTVKLPAVCKTSENPEIQPMPFETIAHDSAEMIESLAVKPPVAYKTSENPEIQPMPSETIVLDTTKTIESSSVKPPVVLNTSKNPEIQPIPLITIAHDFTKTIESSAVKPPVVHNTSKKHEIQPISLITIAPNSTETADSSAIKSPVVLDTSKNPDVQPKIIVPDTSENGKLVVVNSTNKHQTSVKLNVQPISIPHIAFKKVEPSVSKLQTVQDTHKKPYKQPVSLTSVPRDTEENEKVVISSNAHNASKNVESSSVKSSVVNIPGKDRPALFTPHITSEILTVQSTPMQPSIAHNIEPEICISSTVSLAKSVRTCKSHVNSELLKPQSSKIEPQVPSKEPEEDNPTSVISIAQPLLGESSHSVPKSHSDTYAAKLDKRIQHLERFLKKLDARIKKLNARDMSLDDLDDDDSLYILEDRYRRKFVKVWEKLCSLKKCSPRFGRETEKRFHYKGSRFDPVNKAIERFINKRKPNDRFPNYNEVLDVVKRVNEDHDLGLPSKSVEKIAEEAFLDVGRELKKRRIKDYNKDFGCALTDDIDFENDPAEHDENLKLTLSHSLSIGQQKITEIVNKYANENVEEEDDERIEGDVCEPPIEEVQDDNELPDTDPVNNSSDEETKNSPSAIGFIASKRKDDLVVDIECNSNASTEPGSPKVRHKTPSLVPNNLKTSPVIFTSDIEIVECSQEAIDDYLDTSPKLPSLSNTFSLRDIGTVKK